MSGTSPSSRRRSRLASLATKAFPHSHRDSTQPLAGPVSPSIQEYRDRYDSTPSPSQSYTDPFSSQQGHVSGMTDNLLPPQRPFSEYADGRGSGPSSRRSSFSSDKGLARPPSLSINYVPNKFTRLRAPGNHAHRRAKTGGGRDAFAADASRMGQMGVVDDDEGVVYQIGKGGLKKQKPKLRWNRFKWALFVANTVLLLYGLGTLITGILVWLNVFYRADVIRAGNRTELILSTLAAASITFTALLGYSGIVLNNRAFLATYTLLLWVCLGFLVAPGYLTYKQKTFNLEGKINLQYSRRLGTEGRLRIQNALKCCGYFSPYVEATQSPLCYARSNLPGCKDEYLHLERSILQKWYTISFVLVPAHILIIITSLLCSNHITYRFGKGLTPERYRLDMGSMAVIMDQYAGQIAAQYGPELASEAVHRSSSPVLGSPGHSRSGSRKGSAPMASSSSTNPSLTKATSRLAPGSSDLMGYNSSSGTAYNPASRGTLYDPSVVDSRPPSSRSFPSAADRADDNRYADSGYEDSRVRTYTQPG